VPAENVQAFFDAARNMNFYDDQRTTTRDLFERFFPGREDVVRLLMEPITYANGSTLEDPALTYGIVFSNFMSKGVFTFQGGTDRLIDLMKKELLAAGVDVEVRADVQKVHVDGRRVSAVTLNGQTVKTRSVVSNANLKSTILRLVGKEHFDRDFVEQTEAVRLNNSSAQVYMGLKPGVAIDESCGDLLFSSTAPSFRTEMLLSRNITSRTYSFYYPRTRPDQADARCAIVSSTNANYADWADLPEEEYRRRKDDLAEATLDAIEKYVPNIREKLDYIECATPRTFERYTKHLDGASFGTKFEGLAVSRALPEQIAGLYHAGSVGIIMSGWLGAVNYGVIVANDVDAYLMKVQP
jgi:phytoene dehydrogenase-like protein